MNLAIRPRHGPAARRAVTVIGVAALLMLALSVTDGSDPAAYHPPPPALALPQATSSAAAPSANGAAIRLLAQAATAARTISYRGVQVISWRIPASGGSWLGSGMGRVLVQVWHRTGEQAGQLPDGVLGLTPRLLGLLAAHYAVVCAGTGSAAGRPARIVEAVRPGGGLAARFWLDSATKLPLRRELFDPAAHLISDDAFTGLRLSGPAATGPAAARSSAAGSAAAGSADAGRTAAAAALLQPWTDQLDPAQLATLRTTGWPVPGPRAAGLTLFAASQAVTAAGKVVDLSYSDGLSALSLFVQRGQLAAVLPGWRQTELNGHRLYVRNPAEPSLTWSARGFVFTLVADAPAAVIAGLVNAAPHDAQPGFWGRMNRGLRRLLSWINPFR